MNPSAGAAAWQRPASAVAGPVAQARCSRARSALLVAQIPGGVLLSVVAARGSATGDSADRRSLRLLLRRPPGHSTPALWLCGASRSA